MNMPLFRIAIIGIFMMLELISIISFGIIGGFIPLILLSIAVIGKPRFLLFVLWIWAVIGPTAILYIPSSISIVIDIGLFSLCSDFII